MKKNKKTATEICEVLILGILTVSTAKKKKFMLNHSDVYKVEKMTFPDNGKNVTGLKTSCLIYALVVLCARICVLSLFCDWRGRLSSRKSTFFYFIMDQKHKINVFSLNNDA